MSKPRMNVLLKSDKFKVVQIIGEKGDVIATHKVDTDSILFVKEGNVTYKEEGVSETLTSDDVFQIKENVYHQLQFNHPSQVILTIPNQGKIKFQNK